MINVKNWNIKMAKDGKGQEVKRISWKVNNKSNIFFIPSRNKHFYDDVIIILNQPYSFILSFFELVMKNERNNCLT